jgi:hypothetical protein
VSVASITDWSRTKLCMACWGWVVTLGVVLAGWNLHAGHPMQAVVVSLLMLVGAVVYVADMVSTVVARTGKVL